MKSKANTAFRASFFLPGFMHSELYKIISSLFGIQGNIEQLNKLVL